MKNFDSRFLNTLLEQDEPINPDEVTPEGDAAAFGDALNPETSPDDFRTEPSSPGFKADHIEKVKEWIDKIQSFADLLNSTDEGSLNKFLTDFDYEGSPIEGVSTQASKVTGAAASLVAVIEMLKGAAIKGTKKIADAAIQQQET